MAKTLINRDLDSGSGDYLDVLLVLVNKYENEQHAISEELTPQKTLRALMEFNGLNQGRHWPNNW